MGKSERSIVVGYFIDEFASIGETQKNEIAAMKKLFRKALPKRKLIFKVVEPINVRSEPGLDAFFYDIGGLCYVDQSGAMRERMTIEVLNAVRDRPSVVFIPYSNFTCRDFFDIIHHEQTDLMTAPNVVSGYAYRNGGCSAKEDKDGHWMIDQAIAEGIKRWFS